MDEKEFLNSAVDAISVFCRLNVNAKKDLPIRISEMGLLIFLSNNRGPVTPHQVADTMKVKKPMVTDMVASLYGKGYLTKSPSATDHRSYTLHLTDKAEKLVEEAYAEYMRGLKALIEKMGEEDFNQMISLLKSANEIILDGRESN